MRSRRRRIVDLVCTRIPAAGLDLLLRVVLDHDKYHYFKESTMHIQEMGADGRETGEVSTRRGDTQLPKEHETYGRDTTNREGHAVRRNGKGHSINTAPEGSVWCDRQSRDTH